MKREENPGSSEIVTLLVVLGGGYLIYNYLVSSGQWAQWFGGAAATTGGVTIQTIAAGLQANPSTFVGAGTDASGNTIVHDVATGAYYAVNPTSGAVSAASGPGTTVTPGQQPTTTVPITQPNPVTTPPVTVTLTTASPLAQQLNAAATQYLQNMIAMGTPAPGGGLTIDQWIFYYQQIKGVSLSGAQEEALIQSAGLSDATRSTIIPLGTFVNALNGVGLSGIVTTPNNGQIRAPLPTTQNFSGGYGGYSGGGYGGRKGYLN